MSSYQKGESAGEYSNLNGTTLRNGAPYWSMKKKVVVLLGIIIVVSVTISTLSKSLPNKEKNIDISSENLELLDEQKRFIIEDFDIKPTFSSFLPGVAGIYGKPIWSFYVNRGQGIASFGTISKNFPILEFNAANKAYQLTAFIGFRTFVNATRRSFVRGEESVLLEPFSPNTSRNPDEPNEDTKPKRYMYVGPNEMELKEVDAEHEITTKVHYFVLPEEDFGALVRRTTFTNDGSDTLILSALDGLAKMEPSGGPLDWDFKNMGRTVEGWMGVYQADGDGLTMPFYRLSTEPKDSADVTIVYAGHYCLSFIESENDATLLPIIYDTSKIFGPDTNLLNPTRLETRSIHDILNGPQYGNARTSSAFSALDSFELGPGESVTITSFYGKAEHIEQVPKIANVVTKAGYVKSKAERAKIMIDELTSAVETNTANRLFDGSVKQMFLDNSLRGGMPQIIGDIDDDAKFSTFDEDPRVKVYHTFSRIHGDLERDYNDFNIEYSYFSQGPGNFRDIAQNRRDDVSFLPRMGSFDIQEFLSYIQADGYEPLTIEGVVYTIQDNSTASDVSSAVTADAKSAQNLKEVLLDGAFRPGELFQSVEKLQINLSVENQLFIDQILAVSESNTMGNYKTGYWSDHWEYYLDLIDSFLSIYPDREEALMYDSELPYFFSDATVRPRREKYVLTPALNGLHKRVQQLNSTVIDTDRVSRQGEVFYNNTKLGVTLGIDASWQYVEDGSKLFKSTPIAKLFLLGAIKFATRDAYGMGIEYEGGRPGWNDAMNGLPGLVGSGMPETFELYELLGYVKKVVGTYKRPLVIPSELWKMIGVVNKALDELENDGYEDASGDELSDRVPDALFKYWDAVASARESYRSDIQYYFSGNTSQISVEDTLSILDRWIGQVEIGITRAIKMGSLESENGDGTSIGIPPAYFAYNITTWEEIEENEYEFQLVKAQEMTVNRFPLFLESPVRYMKTISEDKSAMKDIYDKVFKSGLRDTKLNMYFLSASLEGMSYEMGRMMAFSPGWLENQSIWMHMSYKYYLQLLRGKLYDEFFAEMRGGGILPFMDPDIYGRSLMECSSFLASGAFSDPSMVGRGFSARLSGSTAEFLSMWKLMFVGPNPFILGDDDKVLFQLTPTLPFWLFSDPESGIATSSDSEGNPIVSFKLFARILVTYHNTISGNLFDVYPSKYVITMVDGTNATVLEKVVPTEYAIEIRKMYNVKSIDAYF